MAGDNKQARTSWFHEIFSSTNRVAAPRKVENPFLRTDPGETAAVKTGGAPAKKRAGPVSAKKSVRVPAKGGATSAAMKNVIVAAKSVTPRVAPGSVPFPKK